MKNKSIRWGWATGAALAAVMLAGCGGGGGGGDSGSGTGTPTTPPVTSTNTFDVSTAYRARTQAGATETYRYVATNGSVTCNDSRNTSTFTFSPTGPATFEGATALSATQTVTSATPTPGCEIGSGTGTNFYNASFIPIGVRVNPDQPSEQYGVLVSAGTLPGAAKVNDTGTIATLDIYSSIAKTTKIGSRAITYVIEPDTATTAIVNITTKSYDNSATPQLLSTEQKRYRIAAGGTTLTVVSDDVQFSTTSTIRIVYTPS